MPTPVPKDEVVAAYWALLRNGYFCLKDEEPRTVLSIIRVVLRAAAKARGEKLRLISREALLRH